MTSTGPTPGRAIGGFVGRDADLARLDALLSDAGCVVTLSGPPGIGKTRLAREMATRVAGAVWVDADAGNGASGAGLADRLATSGTPSRLIVLDGLDGDLSAASSALDAWRLSHPDTSVLVTSRGRLRCTDEILHRLGPLFPSETEELFLRRAQAVSPDFAASESDVAVCAEIAPLLRGLPLAVERTAARAAVLPPAELLARLAEPFRLLPRLREAIERSWKRFTDAEKAALAQCSVLEGGFALAVAETVVVPGPSTAAGLQVLDLIQSLVDQSVLARGADGTLRFAPFVREFAAERLEATGDACSARARRDLGAAAEALEAGDASSALGRLLGLDLSLDTTQLDVPVATATLLERAATETPDLHDRARRAQALTIAGELRRTHGELDAARTDLERALALCASEPVGGHGSDADADVVASRATAALGIVRHEQGDLDAAAELHTRALAGFRALGDLRGEGRALLSLAILHGERGRTDDAQIHYEWALTLLRRVEDERSQAIVWCNLGDLHREQRRTSEAREAYERALTSTRRIGDRRVEGVVRGNLGATHHERGDFEAARECFAAAIHLLGEAGDVRLESVFRGYLAALEREAADGAAGLGRSIGLYREAIDTLRGAGDRRYAGLFGAHLGSALAAAGHRVSADAALSDARRSLNELGDTALLTAFGVHDALSRTDISAADGHEALRTALATAEPLAATSDEVRYAMRLALRALGDEAEYPERRPSLTVSVDGGAIVLPDGEPLDLSRRGPMRRMVAGLASARQEHPGRGLSVDELLAIGWPGEKVIPEAGANRVYVALATLRKLGLREVLLSRDDGYLLDPGVDMER